MTIDNYGYRNFLRNIYYFAAVIQSLEIVYYTNMIYPNVRFNRLLSILMHFIFAIFLRVRISK